MARPFPRVLAKETAQLSDAIVSSGTDHGNRAGDGQISCIVDVRRSELQLSRQSSAKRVGRMDVSKPSHETLEFSIFAY